MRMSEIPFGTTDWSAVEATEHKGDHYHIVELTGDRDEVRNQVKWEREVAGQRGKE